MIDEEVRMQIQAGVCRFIYYSGAVSSIMGNAAKNNRRAVYMEMEQGKLRRWNEDNRKRLCDIEAVENNS